MYSSLHVVYTVKVYFIEVWQTTWLTLFPVRQRVLHCKRETIVRLSIPRYRMCTSAISLRFRCTNVRTRERIWFPSRDSRTAQSHNTTMPAEDFLSTHRKFKFVIVCFHCLPFHRVPKKQRSEKKNASKNKNSNLHASVYCVVRIVNGVVFVSIRLTCTVYEHVFTDTRAQACVATSVRLLDRRLPASVCICIRVEWG